MTLRVLNREQLDDLVGPDPVDEPEPTSGVAGDFDLYVAKLDERGIDIGPGRAASKAPG